MWAECCQETLGVTSANSNTSYSHLGDLMLHPQMIAVPVVSVQFGWLYLWVTTAPLWTLLTSLSCVVLSVLWNHLAHSLSTEFCSRTPPASFCHMALHVVFLSIKLYVLCDCVAFLEVFSCTLFKPIHWLFPIGVSYSCGSFDSLIIIKVIALP